MPLLNWFYVRSVVKHVVNRHDLTKLEICQTGEVSEAVGKHWCSKNWRKEPHVVAKSAGNVRRPSPKRASASSCPVCREHKRKPFGGILPGNLK